MKSVPDIAFDLVPSQWLDLATVLLAALALGSAIASGAPWALTTAFVAAATAIGAGSIAARRRQRGRLAWLGDGRWRWLRDHTETFPTLSSARVLGPLIVLRFDAPRSVVLLPDNVDRGTARRLRVRLATLASD